MPAFNAEHTISNAINSIINQSFSDWELIIVDDGSMDNTFGAVRKFNDPRIKYVLRDHEGIVASRNYGNSVARGKFIAIQDADDLSMPNRLEKCLPHLFNYDIVIHGGYINMWDAQYQCIGRRYLPAPKMNKKELLNGQNLPGWPVFRKIVWEKKPFRMETQFAYDWMMYLDWAYSGFKFKSIDEGLYEYVRQQNSASQVFEKSGKRQESFEKIQEIMKHEYAV